MQTLPGDPPEQRPCTASFEESKLKPLQGLDDLQPVVEGSADLDDSFQTDWEHVPSSLATSTTTFALLSPPTSPSVGPSEKSLSDCETSGDEESAEESDSDDSDDSRPAKRKRATYTYGSRGTSKSAMASQRLKEAMRDGSLKPNHARLERFKKTCLEHDEHAEFQVETTWRVFHSLCGDWVAMREPYDTKRFRDHVHKCNEKQLTKKDGLGGSKRSSTLDSWVQRSKSEGREEHESGVVVEDSETGGTGIAVAEVVPGEAVAAVTGQPKASGAVKKPPQQEDESRGKRKRSRKTEEVPCCGITAAIEPRVVAYLERTGTQGGGAPNITSIARELFHDDSLVFSKLTSAQKQLARTEQSHRQTWRNDHTSLAVFATSCKHSCPAPDGLCSERSTVHHSKPFRTALRVPAPEPDRYKYLNAQYKNETVGKIYGKTLGLKEILEDRVSDIAIRYAYSANKPLCLCAEKRRFGMVALGCCHPEREDEGPGGFPRHHPSSDGCARSPRTWRWQAELQLRCRTTRVLPYRSDHLSGGLPRAIHASPAASVANSCVCESNYACFFSLSEIVSRRNRAKAPRFPTDICAETFERARRYINDLGYGSGPVALSCDDTKLHAAWRTYYDKEKDTHFLVGGTNGPMAVANVEEMNEILRNSSDGDKATKVRLPCLVCHLSLAHHMHRQLRLWCLHPTLPKVPPLILAAKAIPNNLTVDELFTMLKKILYGLIGVGVGVVSYACDGTEMERSVQNLLVSTAETHVTYSIPHPVSSQLELTVRIPIISNQPVIPVQDAKHFAKTVRNNAFSGARFITLGNFYVSYSQIRDLAFDPDGLLYHRDVEKVDRQDDNAAIRLFSSHTLQHIVTRYPDRPGLAVYLLLNGELVRAYTSPQISHLERTKMVLRTHYFYALWKRYLDESGHSPQRHGISREALDIVRILVNGFISLMIVQRPHRFDAAPFPAVAPLNRSVRTHLWPVPQARCRLLIPRLPVHDPATLGSYPQCGTLRKFDRSSR